MAKELSPAATSLAAGEARSRLREVFAQFSQSKIAVSATVVLALVILLALFAPWLSPQNPYDLSSIDVADGRKVPGTVRMTKLKTAALRVTLASTNGDLPIRSTRAEDAELVQSLRLTASWDDAGTNLVLALNVDKNNVLFPLREMTLTGLPRATIVSGAVKDKFRARWTIPAGTANNIEVKFKDAPRKDLRLRLNLIGGAQTKIMTYWLGTDAQGRDMLSAILYGLRISLAVAVTSVLIALSIGTALGLYAAYWGGRFEAIVMRIVDLQISFPTILVALILLAILGKGVGNVMLALVIVQWAFYARTARGIALSEGSKEYIEACRCLALPTSRIIAVHLLPNCLPPLIVVATLQVAGAISLEATLSFLGLGLPVTEPSLGLLISNGFQYLLSGYPWISVLPGVALLITVVGINLVGDELRDILNPRLES